MIASQLPAAASARAWPDPTATYLKVTFGNLASNAGTTTASIRPESRTLVVVSIRSWV